jgi:AcrR family transcriptional regulator
VRAGTTRREETKGAVETGIDAPGGTDSTGTAGAGHADASPAVDARATLLDRAIEHFARNGIGDTSLRGLATAIGTSHRMILYHFGSREGLLGAVVDRVEAGGRSTLAELAATEEATRDPFEAGQRFWRAITDQALIYGPLFFELSSHAMEGLPHAAELRTRLVEPWIEAQSRPWVALGVPDATARIYARLDLAMARGLLHDLLLTGDRPAIDRAMQTYAREAIQQRTGFAAPTSTDGSLGEPRSGPSEGLPASAHP